MPGNYPLGYFASHSLQCGGTVRVCLYVYEIKREKERKREREREIKGTRITR